MLISFSGRTKQIFFLFIKLEPGLLSWLQPRKNNCVPTELDVSISANVFQKMYVNVNSMKHSPKLMFLNKNLLQKDSNDSGHQKLTLKVRIRDF